MAFAYAASPKDASRREVSPPDCKISPQENRSHIDIFNSRANRRPAPVATYLWITRAANYASGQFNHYVLPDYGLAQDGFCIDNYESPRSITMGRMGDRPFQIGFQTRNKPIDLNRVNKQRFFYEPSKNSFTTLQALEEGTRVRATIWSAR